MRVIPRSLLLAAVALAASAVAFVSPASAAPARSATAAPAAVAGDSVVRPAAVGCPGCHGQDPIATGCANDATTVLEGFFSWGHLELRWSPSCQTNWTRFTANVSDTWEVSVHRSDGASFGDLVLGLQAGQQWYTNMVYAPSLPAAACANVTGGDTGGCIRQPGYPNP